MAATIVFAISHLSNQLWLLFSNSEMEKQGTRVFFPYKRTLAEKEREGEGDGGGGEREKNTNRLDEKEKTANKAGVSGASCIHPE